MKAMFALTSHIMDGALSVPIVTLTYTLYMNILVSKVFYNLIIARVLSYNVADMYQYFCVLAGKLFYNINVLISQSYWLKGSISIPLLQSY